MTCRWNGRTEPRTVAGRHLDTCPGDPCPGCAPCPHDHCRVCYRTHADGTCAECLAVTRDALHQIATMCDALPAEVVHRGINGEAMVLTGPVADVEARGHVEASYLAGRLPEGWIEASHGKGCPLLAHEACTGCAGDERHPLTVLLTWQDVWRDALDHDEAPDNRLATAVDYLDRTMSYMAGYEHVPFEDFARDLRHCENHCRGVLHDQNQGDRANVGCFECGEDLERRLTERDGFEDFWTCTGCRRRYTVAEYNFALRARIEEESA
jgi:hypothetical protein